MKLWIAGISLAGILCGALSSFQNDKTATLVITGDFQGSLEPCGCTLPTTGGILRQAALVRTLRQKGDVTVLANGAMVAGLGKQDRYKTEVLADIYSSMSAAAINLSADDARLGVGGLMAVQNVSSGRLISGSVQSNGELTLNATVANGPFLIGGLSSRPEALARPLRGVPVETSTAVGDLVSEAKTRELIPVLLLDGSQAEASNLAKKNRDLRLIVYRSPNDPPAAPMMVGHTMLVTPGEKGKFVLTLRLSQGNLVGYQPLRLDTSVVDDPQAAKLYKMYLDRVEKSDLLEHVSRVPTGEFAGSKACKSCHTKSFDIWEHSKHSQGLASLEKVNHKRDPDCVSCHVVGLGSTVGFRSRLATPNLADVGCESCHGPGKKHVQNPRLATLPRTKLDSCKTCHTPEQSPNFNALTYWEKIQHK